jgi:hypothetical protein
MNSISRGWQLLTQSWSIIRQDTSLILFPLMSSIACLIVAASFLVPMILYVMAGAQNDFHNVNNQQADGPELNNIVYYVWLFAFYFVNFFVIVFFNTALVSCAVMRFTGGTPTVGDGLRTACARLPQIAGWALLSATVGMLLKMLEERLSFLGKFVVNFIGVAWSIAAYFVIPVLAVEQLGPIAAVKRSASLVRKSWGEAFVGGISLGLISFLLAIPGILLCVLTGYFIANAAPNGFHFVTLAPAIIGVVYLIGLSIVISTLQQIFLAGVYLYAAEGRVANGFTEDTLISAFKAK